ncbi:serine hydrolase domain-containing protein [Longitalea arenae]|uniref:serine hydrolase domain-containing protein n=1 Tax=Longitalea arenae TaxID=2812558 RepID=UPI0019688E2A|nr:serine hydrolase [Longitalea arenae]
MRLPLLIFFKILVAGLFAQSKDLVTNQGITSAFHRENLGKILFTAQNIPVAKLLQKDVLTEYTLTNKSDLFMTVFMGNSMTNYMHSLAPHLPADSLVKTGNYQFSLFIDNRLVYESNLYPGAPNRRVQDTATVISKPLIDNKHEGVYWTQSYWQRFLLNGGDSALTDGKHLLHMQIRPYVQLQNEIKVGDIIAEGSLNLTVQRSIKIDLADIRLNPLQPYPGFGISTDKFDRKKIITLKAHIEQGTYKHINGLIIVSNGNLLIEEYFNGENRFTLHDPRSVGKSFASTITGIAIQEGYLKDEEQRLSDFYDLDRFQHYAAEKEDVSIKDLLTMSAVIDGDDNSFNSPGNEENMYPAKNWVKFALDLPVKLARPAGEWHYFTAGVVVLGDILHKCVPDGLEKYAHLKLFKPLGISEYEWSYTPQHVANTAGGIRLRALDFAKYGQLYKNEGKWNGRQILPVQWIKKTFTRHKKITGRMDEYYGYLFWNKKYRVAGATYETWYCTGNGGNKIFIFPDHPWVIVVTASAYGAPYAHPQVDKMMTEYILPALTGK